MHNSGYVGGASDRQSKDATLAQTYAAEFTQAAVSCILFCPQRPIPNDSSNTVCQSAP